MKTSVFIDFVTKGWLNVEYRKMDNTTRQLRLTASPLVNGTSSLDYTNSDRLDLVPVYSDEHLGIITVYPANIVRSIFIPIDEVPKVGTFESSLYYVTDGNFITLSHSSVEAAVKAYVDECYDGDIDEAETVTVLKFEKTIKIVPNKSYNIEDAV